MQDTLQTHFIRQKAGYHTKFYSPVESLIYQALPQDRLVTLEDIYTLLQNLCKSNAVGRPGRKNLDMILGDLATRGFVKRVEGKKLERLLAMA